MQDNIYFLKYFFLVINEIYASLFLIITFSVSFNSILYNPTQKFRSCFIHLIELPRDLNVCN